MQENTDLIICVCKDLHDALKKRFQNSDMRNVRVVNKEEISFLKSCGISHEKISSVNQLKDIIMFSEFDNKFWIDKAKEVSAEIDANTILPMLPEFIDIFKQIIGNKQLDTLTNVLKLSLTLKVEMQNSANSNWDIFALRKNDNDQYQIAIFRIEALRINNQWDLHFFKLGKNVFNIAFYGLHIRAQT